jgi:hypothetical protein
MNLFMPFLVALLTGGLIFGAIYKKNPWNDALGILVAFWLGLAGCAMVAFYSIMFTGHYDPFNVVITTFIFMILCCLLCYYRQGRPFLFFPKLHYTTWFKFFIVVLVAWMLIEGVAYHKLYGDWDGWSYWNFRAHYLVSAGSHWRDVYTYGAQVKHPWLLPYWIVFGWAWGGESYSFPFYSAQIFGLIVLATVFFSILNLTKNENASFLATLWLASVPYFSINTTSQYADVLTASLIVLSLMLFFRLYQQKTKANALTLGLMLGVMSFSKDEGIVSTLMIILLLIVLIKGSKKLYLPFFLGLGLMLVPTVLAKYWMIPAAQRELNALYFPHFFEWQRWVAIIQYFWVMLMKPRYGGILIIPFCLLVSMLFKPLDKKDWIMAVFIMMFVALFFFLYVLVSDDLNWRLLCTAERLAYQILPLAIVFLFYRLFKAFPSSD